jgi:hypothetical protein
LERGDEPVFFVDDNVACWVVELGHV